MKEKSELCYILAPPSFLIIQLSAGKSKDFITKKTPSWKNDRKNKRGSQAEYKFCVVCPAPPSFLIIQLSAGKSKDFI